MEIIKTKRENGTTRVQIKLSSESEVEQSHRQQVNINSIIKKYRKTGLFPQRTDRPRYGDFTGTYDYHEACTRTAEAESEFNELPAHIRQEFNNDPGELIEYLNDPENVKEAVEKGLLPITALEGLKSEKSDPEPVEAPKPPAQEPKPAIA